MINKGSIAHQVSFVNGKWVPHKLICQVHIDNEHLLTNRKRKRKDNRKNAKEKIRDQIIYIDDELHSKLLLLLQTSLKCTVL